MRHKKSNDTNNKLEVIFLVRCSMLFFPLLSLISKDFIYVSFLLSDLDFIFQPKINNIYSLMSIGGRVCTGPKHTASFWQKNDINSVNDIRFIFVLSCV